MNRTKKSAEVFTPSWICNEMNNSCDEEWFGYKNVFNVPHGHEWIPKPEPIHFANDGDWQKYVDSRRLEITCGEAPFLTSRYDVVSGDVLQVEKRIGILDRKLRVVNENTNDETEWFKWAKRAFESTYGYEYQGDSLFLARKNLLFTFIENYAFKFHREPELAQVKQIANVIAWNVWQMDGLNDCVPFSYEEKQEGQLDLFGDLPKILLPVPCKIRNWRSDKVYYFKELRGGKKMKFGVVIGNPPYQKEKKNTSDNPVYHMFMNEAYKIADFVELITPARFLFNAGKTPKEWNEKMLNDEHFKVLKYEPLSGDVFKTDIKGGVAIHCRNSKVNYEKIENFTPYKELNSILLKVKSKMQISIKNIIYTQNKFNLDVLYKDYPQYKNAISSDGKEKRLTSNCFKFEVFSDNEIDNAFKIIGLVDNERKYKYIEKKYIELPHENLEKYKVILPGSNGSGAIGETLSTPLIGHPLIGHTQTFVSIGAFDTLNEAENTMKYIKSKFARCMLGVLKVTQSNKKETWKYVPMQDFTNNSDIDWSKSIHEIDLQLYKKYNLNQDEINFIETRIKEMK